METTDQEYTAISGLVYVLNQVVKEAKTAATINRDGSLVLDKYAFGPIVILDKDEIEALSTFLEEYETLAAEALNYLKDVAENIKYNTK